MERTFEWELEKNKKLIKERGISFERIVSHIENGDIMAIAQGKGNFRHQKQFVINVDGYAYIVPFVETEDQCFLKTIIPSRKMTRRYLSGGEANAEE